MAEIQVYVKNNTNLLWNASTQLIPDNDKPFFYWEPVALYPGQALPPQVPAEIIHDQPNFDHRGSNAVHPQGPVMPGMTAFCPVKLAPPSGPGQYRLHGSRTASVPLVYLGPERNIPWYTDIYLQHDTAHRDHLIDTNFQTNWTCPGPVYPGTGFHLYFQYPRRVQWIYLYGAQTDPGNPDRMKHQSPIPENLSILFSQHAESWERVIAETKWNPERQALDIWFTPRDVHHMAIHTTREQQQPLTISEIRLL